MGCSGESRAWTNAVEVDSQEAYEHFIQEYPGSKHLAEADLRVGELNWEEALASDSVDSYEQFMQEYPASEHLAEAQLRVSELRTASAWESASSANSISAYYSFLTVNAESPQSNLALERIVLLEAEALDRALTGPERLAPYRAVRIGTVRGIRTISESDSLLSVFFKLAHNGTDVRSEDVEWTIATGREETRQAAAVAFVTASNVRADGSPYGLYVLGTGLPVCCHPEAELTG